MDFTILVDAGLFVLIWMVQLLVYPSFLYYSKEDLHRWHIAYTPRITVIVAPLMLVQLGFAAFQLYEYFTVISMVYALLVVVTWVVTFALFIPLHGKIQTGEYDRELLHKLVNWNWIRTALWTAILLLSGSRFIV